MELDARAANGGKFISRGRGRHICRTIDSWELIVVSSGTLDMFTGRDEFHLEPGEWLILPAGVRHGGRVDYPSDLVFFWLHFYPRKGMELPRTGKISDMPQLVELLQVYLTRQARAPQDRTALDLVLALILHALSETAEALSQDRDIPPLPRQCEQMLQLRFREPISISDIAVHLQCSPDYLGRLFRRHYKLTPTEYLIQIRIQHAAALLASSPLQINQIAADVGFSDPAYFRRCFFRLINMSPRQYRILKSPTHINTA